MTKGSKHEGGRGSAPATDGDEVFTSAIQMSELMRANAEAMIQAWTTTARGMLSYHEHLTRFVGMRIQKDVEMAKTISQCRDLDQFVEQQTAFGRTMVEDYMHEGEDMLQSALDIIRDSGRPMEQRAEEAPQELRQAV